MLFPFNLGLSWAFFGREIWCEKLGKSKANSLPKYQMLPKNGHYLTKFLSTKKRCKMA